MKVTAEDYREAANDHIAAALELWETRRFVLAQYTAGLAAESMLLGYSLRVDAEFDARHSIVSWYEKSGIEARLTTEDIANVSTALGVLEFSWRNEQRYYSEQRLRAYFKRMALDRGLRGNAVKELTKRTIEAAQVIVTVGEKRWNRSSKR